MNSANPIKGLTKKQVEQIFTGDVADWSAVGGSAGKISVYTRNTSSGTYSDFKELAMKKRDYAGGSQKMAGNEQIAAEVGKNPNGVGYVGLAYTKAGGVKRCRSMAQCPRPKVCRRTAIRMAPHVLLHKRRPEWFGEGIRRFHDGPERPKNRGAGWICADQMNRSWLG